MRYVRSASFSGVLVAGILWATGCGNADSPLAQVQPPGKGAWAKDRSALGTPVPWPDGYDGSLVSEPVYSASGRYLAFRARGGDTGVLDFSSAEVREFATDFAPDRPNVSYTVPMWVSGTALLVHENWQTPEQWEQLQADGPLDMELAWRVTDVETSETLFYKRTGTNGADVPFLPVAARNADEWLVLDGEGVRLYYPDTDTLGDLLLSVDRQSQRVVETPEDLIGEENVIWSRDPLWVGRSRSLDGRGRMDLHFLNVQTLATVELADVPAAGVPQITSDGRYVITARWLKPGFEPVIIDTQTGQRYTPPDEGWVPLALSEARGVVLVRLLGELDEDGVRGPTQWYEVPLAALIGQ